VRTERRAERRFEICCPTEVALVSPGPLAGVTHDVSTNGVVVLTHQSLPIGEELEFDLLVEDRRVTVRGRVVRQEEMDDDSFWNYKTAVELTETAYALLGSMARVFAAEVELYS
jgi:hypothetical protein